MTRFGYAIVTALSVQAFVGLSVAVAMQHPAPRLIWNASASAPLGLYSLRAVDDPPLGALVAATPPAPLARWLAERRYLPRNVPLLKHVAAKAGQRICRTDSIVDVDGRPLAIARSRDSRGRPLPVWRGCRTLKLGEVLLLNAAPDSMDGRYFGPLPESALLGRATPVLTRDAPEAPLVWRGLRP